MKQLFIFTLIVALLSPVTTYAETIEQSSSSMEEILSGKTLDNAFTDMKNNLQNGKEVSFAQSLEKVGGLTISADAKYDLSDTSIDFDNLDASLTNLGFSQLSASLAGSFNSIDLSGNSAGCMQLFENSFGNLSETLKLEEPTLPEEFDADTMLSESKNAINKAYSSALKEDSFKNVKKSISIGSIFTKANKGLEQLSLSGTDALKTALGIKDKNLEQLFDNNSKQFDEDANLEKDKLTTGFPSVTELLHEAYVIDATMTVKSPSGAIKDNSLNILDKDEIKDRDKNPDGKISENGKNSEKTKESSKSNTEETQIEVSESILELINILDKNKKK